jgi:hypothetical protein
MVSSKLPRSFVAFYWALFKWAVSETYGVLDTLLTFSAVALFIATFFSKELAQALERQWQGLPRWYSLIPVAILLGYRMMRANYSHFETAVTTIDSLEDDLKSERERTQQPDVALLWDWTDEQRAARTLSNHMEKSILVDNRSDHTISRIQVDSEPLRYPIQFDEINEILPQTSREAVGRWDMSTMSGTQGSQSTTMDGYNHHILMNSEDLEAKGWIKVKPHNRGMSGTFMEIPMSVTFGSQDAKWKIEFDFHYDPRDEDSYFIKKRGYRI